MPWPKPVTYRVVPDRDMTESTQSEMSSRVEEVKIGSQGRKNEEIEVARAVGTAGSCRDQQCSDDEIEFKLRSTR